MRTGIIRCGSSRGRAFGFTPDLFTKASYLWLHAGKKRVLISFIHSIVEGRGDFSRLVGRIEAAGYRVAVPCPLAPMIAVLHHWGWQPRLEYSRGTREWVDVWEAPPPERCPGCVVHSTETDQHTCVPKEA